MPMSAIFVTESPAWRLKEDTVRKKMYLLNTVVSSYETSDVIRLLRQVDSRVIINIMKTERFVGSFYRKPME